MKYRLDRETSHIHSIQFFESGEWIPVTDIFPSAFREVFSLNETDFAKWQRFLKLMELSVRPKIGDFNTDLIGIDIYEDRDGWLVVRSVFPDTTPELDRKNVERLGILSADGALDRKRLDKLFKVTSSFCNPLNNETLKTYLDGEVTFDALQKNLTNPDTVWLQFFTVLLPAEVRAGQRKIHPDEQSFLLGWFNSAESNIHPNSPTERRLILTQLGALHPTGELNMGRAFQISGLIWENRHLPPNYLLLFKGLRRFDGLRLKGGAAQKCVNAHAQKTKRQKVKKARRASRKSRKK